MYASDKLFRSSRLCTLSTSRYQVQGSLLAVGGQRLDECVLLLLRHLWPIRIGGRTCLHSTGPVAVHTALIARYGSSNTVEGRTLYARRLPQPRDLRVSTPVTGFVPSAYLQSLSCCERSTRAFVKSAP